MSAENVQAFYAKMEDDEALLAKVGGLHPKAQENMDEAVDELIKIAAAEGFEFTAEEYHETRKHEREEPEVAGQAATALGGCNSNWTCARVKTM